MTKSIEAKAQINDRGKLMQRLTDLSISLNAPSYQMDTYFTADKKDFEIFRPKENFLRVREVEGEIFFTLKQPQTNEFDVIDKTITVDKREVLIEIITLLGYEEIISVSKMRQTAFYDGWDLCIDAVEGLGDFIEIKYKGENESEEIQKKQKEFLFSLGIDEKSVSLSGYDTLLYKKEMGLQ